MEDIESLDEFLKMVFDGIKKETFIEFKTFSEKKTETRGKTEIKGVIKYVNSRKYFRDVAFFDTHDQYEKWVNDAREKLEDEFAKQELYFEKIGEQHYRIFQPPGAK